MAPRRAAQTTTTDEATRTITITQEQWDRIVRLAETATVKQKPAQVIQTAIHQGIKTIEKRRKNTQEARIEKAKATLRANGISSIEDDDDTDSE